MARPEAKAAASWWAQWLRKVATFDNGDTGVIGAMATRLTTSARRQMNFTESQCMMFEDALASLIDDHILRSTQSEFEIYCDYDPDVILREAWKRSGLAARDLSLKIFPWKTSMLIDQRAVSVRFGYGSSRKQIWPHDPSMAAGVEATGEAT